MRPSRNLHKPTGHTSRRSSQEQSNILKKPRNISASTKKVRKIHHKNITAHNVLEKSHSILHRMSYLSSLSSVPRRLMSSNNGGFNPFTIAQFDDADEETGLSTRAGSKPTSDQQNIERTKGPRSHDNMADTSSSFVGGNGSAASSSHDNYTHSKFNTHDRRAYNPMRHDPALSPSSTVPTPPSSSSTIPAGPIPVHSMHDVLQGTKPISRKQFRTLTELDANPEVIDALITKTPPQLCLCRGCGIKFQYVEPDRPGFIPAANLQSYLLRLDLQLRAAKQDLRIRSAGGKGQGTAIAALQASLKASLNHVHKETMTRKGITGAYTHDKLRAMGLDDNMKPLVRATMFDENGLPMDAPVPEDNPVLVVSDEDIMAARRKRDRQLQRLLNNPDADPKEIQRLRNMDITRESVSEQMRNAGHHNDMLDKRDVDMLEKAAKLAAKPAKCQRCHRLGSQQYNAVTENSSQSLAAEEFIQLLSQEFNGPDAKNAVIIKLVDIMDFHGSMIRDLNKLTGPRNPIIIAVNKCDVLPYGLTATQIQSWAKKQVEAYGINCHSVFTISAHKGRGLDELVDKALVLARGRNDPNAPRNRNIYIMGTTNVGKSTLINHLLKRGVVGTGLPNDVTGFATEHKNKNINPDGTINQDVIDTVPIDDDMERGFDALNKGDVSPTTQLDHQHQLLATVHDRDDPNINHVIADIDMAGINKTALEAVLPNQYLINHQREIQLKEAGATTSPIPGTTLGIVSFPLVEKKRGGKNIHIKDTPGVLNSWQMTSFLDYQELKRVLPVKPIKPLTYRVQAGQTIFLGGLARIDMVAGKPYHISSFVSPTVSVHITNSSRVDKNYLQQQLGVNLLPPLSPERLTALNIDTNMANTPAECEALDALGRASREEYNESSSRSKQIIKTNVTRGKNNKIDTTDIISNMPDPKHGYDKLASLRSDVREKVADALGQLAPVAGQLHTNSPSRTFIDSRGRLVIQLIGNSFYQASHDVVIAGLGWISVTGQGPLTLRISLAGEDASLTQEELEAINEASQVSLNSDEIISSSTVETTNYDHISHSAIKNKGIGGLPTRLRRLLSRVMIRDPLIPNQGAKGSKWTGTPEAVKHNLSRQMTQDRLALLKKQELFNLHTRFPSQYPNPYETPTPAEGTTLPLDNKAIEQSQQYDEDGLPVYKVIRGKTPKGLSNATTSIKHGPLVDETWDSNNSMIDSDDDNSIITHKDQITQFNRLTDHTQFDKHGNIIDPRWKQPVHRLPGQDTQSGLFDAYPGPAPQEYTKEEMDEFQRIGKEKSAERQLEEELHYIDKYKMYKLIKKAEDAGIDVSKLQQESDKLVFRQTLEKYIANSEKKKQIEDTFSKHLSKHDVDMDMVDDMSYGDDSVIYTGDDDNDYGTDLDSNDDDMELRDFFTDADDVSDFDNDAKQQQKKKSQTVSKKGKKRASDDDDDDMSATTFAPMVKVFDSTGKQIKQQRGLDGIEHSDDLPDMKYDNDNDESFSDEFGSEFDDVDDADEAAFLKEFEAIQAIKRGEVPPPPSSSSSSSDVTSATKTATATKGKKSSLIANKKVGDITKETDGSRTIEQTIDADDDDSHGDNYTTDDSDDDWTNAAIYHPSKLHKLDIKDMPNTTKKQQQQQQSKQHKHDDDYTSDGDDDYTTDGDGDDYSGDETSDVEYLRDVSEMPTLSEMEAMSDFDGIDYNQRRYEEAQRKLQSSSQQQHQEYDDAAYQAAFQVKKIGVQTGPQGKIEKGGRRARKAMGLSSMPDKFEDLRQHEKNQERKLANQTLSQLKHEQTSKERQHIRDIKKAIKAIKTSDDTPTTTTTTTTTSPQSQSSSNHHGNDDDDDDSIQYTPFIQPKKQSPFGKQTDASRKRKAFENKNRPNHETSGQHADNNPLLNTKHPDHWEMTKKYTPNKYAKTAPQSFRGGDDGDDDIPSSFKGGSKGGFKGRSGSGGGFKGGFRGGSSSGGGGYKGGSSSSGGYKGGNGGSFKGGGQRRNFTDFAISLTM